MVLLVLIIVLAILYFFGKKSVHHEILINASPEAVWSVLTDTPEYDNWNPTMKLLERKIKKGNKVKYQFTQSADKSYAIETYVKEVIPNKLLNQGGGLTGIISFDHRYLLEAINNKTKVTIHEDYGGIYVNFWNPSPVAKAYQQLNQALKVRVESLVKK
ncbi:MAG: SRPBCC domain-containing protein [Bacteroidota bacterium]